MTLHTTVSSQPAAASGHRSDPVTLVVCSLEPWGEVRRRMQSMVDELVDLRPSLRVLYVDPPTPLVHRPHRNRAAPRAGLRLQRAHPRIHILRPHALPGSLPSRTAGQWLERQVLDAVGELSFRFPILWIGNPAFASLATDTGWPSLYELGADSQRWSPSGRRRARLEEGEHLLLDRASALVASSPEVARTSGLVRRVELVPNGVDVQKFRVPRPRPTILPDAPVALHIGTLDGDRTDVPLILELSRSCPELQIALAGPIDLSREATTSLEVAGNVHLLGTRPHDQVPALLQHADVVIVPHLVNAATERLDPINAYECRAVGRPTVATPVSGFRTCGAPVVLSRREEFVDTVRRMVEAPGGRATPWADPGSAVPTWRERAEAMVVLMDRISPEWSS